MLVRFFDPTGVVPSVFGKLEVVSPSGDEVRRPTPILADDVKLQMRLAVFVVFTQIPSHDSLGGASRDFETTGPVWTKVESCDFGLHRLR
jgi:hypothetical protein